jgi:alpha-tubulin suppressor-like RCC1 family protein
VVNTFLPSQPAIEVDDSSGAIVSGAQGYVTLNWYTDSTCSTAATGAGEGSARIVNGIAQFSFVGSASVGVFYLRGSYNNITPVCSAAITVASNAPAFAYTSPVAYFTNQPISISPNSPVSNINSCLASPSLPTGLTISPTNCIISGTVSTTSPSTTYTITASNGGTSATATISISISTALSSVISTTAIANELQPITTSGGTPPYTAQLISGTGTLSGSSPSFSYRHSIFGAETAQIKISDSQGSIINLTSTSTEAGLSSLSFDIGSGIACASAPFDSTGPKMACWGTLGLTLLNLPSDTSGANGFYPFQKTSGLSVNASNISLGYSFGVYNINNTIWAWGRNDYGQLGSALGTDKYSTPVTVPLEAGASAQTIKKLAAGYDFACVAFNQSSNFQGKVSCWGDNFAGKSGSPSANSTATATSIVGLGVSGTFGVATDIALGREHGCAQQSSNANNNTNAYIKCWGSNFYGQLGNNTNTDSNTAVTPIGLSVSGTTASTPLYRIASGDNHSCAEANSKVWCWGNNAYYQIGTTSATTIKSPYLVGTFSGITAIGAGSNHTCFATGNTVRCWGSNSAGQLGVIQSAIPSGQTQNPQAVTLSDNVTALVIKGDSTCAVLATGVTYCWGKNTSNMLGTTALADSYLPRKMSIIPSETTSCPTVTNSMGGFVKDANGACVCATAGYTFDPATPYCHPQCGFFQVWNPSSNSCVSSGGF